LGETTKTLPDKRKPQGGNKDTGSILKGRPVTLQTCFSDTNQHADRKELMKENPGKREPPEKKGGSVKKSKPKIGDR